MSPEKNDFIHHFLIANAARATHSGTVIKQSTPTLECGMPYTTTPHCQYFTVKKDNARQSALIVDQMCSVVLEHIILYDTWKITMVPDSNLVHRVRNLQVLTDYNTPVTPRIRSTSKKNKKTVQWSPAVKAPKTR